MRLYNITINYKEIVFLFQAVYNPYSGMREISNDFSKNYNRQAQQ
jgi:hypothetical protein